MSESQDNLRTAIAAGAARLIADGGLDYASAKRKAAHEVCGNHPPRGALPDNDEIDAALREHLDLFDDAHASRVASLRQTALDLMDKLQAFTPLVAGAAWKGIAAEHAPVHLQLFPDNPKEVEYWLLDRKMNFDVDTIAHFQGRSDVPVLTFHWHDTPVMVSLYEPNDLRGALREGPRGPARGDRKALLRRLGEAA